MSRFHLHHIGLEALTDEVQCVAFLLHFEPYRKTNGPFSLYIYLSLYVAEKGEKKAKIG